MWDRFRHENRRSHHRKMARAERLLRISGEMPHMGYVWALMAEAGAVVASCGCESDKWTPFLQECIQVGEIPREGELQVWYDEMEGP